MPRKSNFKIINPFPDMDKVRCHGILAFISDEQRMQLYNAPSGLFHPNKNKIALKVSRHLKKYMQEEHDDDVIKFAEQCFLLLFKHSHTTCARIEHRRTIKKKHAHNETEANHA